jgi:hypothetical protein
MFDFFLTPRKNLFFRLKSEPEYEDDSPLVVAIVLGFRMQLMFKKGLAYSSPTQFWASPHEFLQFLTLHIYYFYSYRRGQL